MSPEQARTVLRDCINAICVLTSAALDSGPDHTTAAYFEAFMALAEKCDNALRAIGADASAEGGAA